MQYRIGNGYDVHRFADATASSECSITLGGINIAHERELLAHSDGDVLIHALCDALLGALALGDIGKHFPDTDKQYSGISSLLLLQKVYRLIQDRGWGIANADMTVAAEAPKLSPHILAMREQLASVLSFEIERVSVKATTTEGIGFVGREEGIAAYAVVLLEKI